MIRGIGYFCLLLIILLAGCYGGMRSWAPYSVSYHDDVVEKKLTKRLINQKVFLVSAGPLNVGDSVIDVTRFETAIVTGLYLVKVRNSSLAPRWPKHLSVKQKNDVNFLLSTQFGSHDTYQLYRQLLTLPEVSDVQLHLDYAGGLQLSASKI